MKDFLTDEQVEQEIENLKNSPLVKLAKKDLTSCQIAWKKLASALGMLASGD